MRTSDIRPDTRPARCLLLCIVLPWLLVVAVAAVMLRADDVRRDINGEELPYNAPCSTDSDCAARFGQ